MQALLQKYLDPSQQAQIEPVILQRLAQSSGQEELKMLLQNNNQLAFVLLNSNYRKLMAIPQFRDFLIQNRFFLVDIFFTSNLINQKYILSMIDKISRDNLCDVSFYEYLSTKEAFCEILLASIRKFETLSQTENVLREVDYIVNNFGKKVVNLMATESSLISFETFYFLISQDLHNIFEDDIGNITNIFCTVLHSLNNQLKTQSKFDEALMLSEGIVRIINVIVSKYCDCFNFEQVYIIVLESFVILENSNISTQRICLLFQIFKRLDLALLKNSLNMLCQILLKLSEIQIDSDDPLFYCRNCLDPFKDPQRAYIAHMISRIDESFGFLNCCDLNLSTEIAFLFICRVLKTKSLGLMKDYVKNNLFGTNQIHKAECLNYFVYNNVFNFAVFQFCINNLKDGFYFYKILEYFNILYAKHKNLKSLSLKMDAGENYTAHQFSEIFDKTNDEFATHDPQKDPFKHLLNAQYAVYEDNLQLLNQSSETILNPTTFQKISNIQLNKTDNEYISQYYANYLQNSDANIDCLYSYVSRSLSANNTLSNNSSAYYIYEILGMLCLKSNLSARVSELIQSVVSSKNEHYEYLLQVVSFTIPYNKNLALTLFQNKKLWANKRFQLGLSVITIGLIKNNLIEFSHIEGICMYLINVNPYCCYLILSYCQSSDHLMALILKISGIKCEYDLMMCVLEKFEVNEMALGVINKCVDVLVKKVVDKRAINRFLKSLDKIETKFNDLKHKFDVLRKRNKLRDQEVPQLLPCVEKFYEI